MQNFTHTLKESYEEYKTLLIANKGKFKGIKLTKTLYVTPEERLKGESIERKSKTEIKTEAIKLIQQLPSGNEFENKVRLLTSSTRKEDYVSMFNEVLEATEEENAKDLAEEMEVENGEDRNQNVD